MKEEKKSIPIMAEVKGEEEASVEKDVKNEQSAKPKFIDKLAKAFFKFIRGFWIPIFVILLILAIFYSSQKPSARFTLPRRSPKNFSKIVLPEAIQLNDTMTFRLAEQQSNVAATFWERWRLSNWSSTPTMQRDEVLYCPSVQLTDPFSLRHSNMYWQVLEAAAPDGKSAQPTIKMHLFNAYYDNRTILNGRPVVRIISSHNSGTLGSERQWWCLLWFEGIKSPALVEVEDYYDMWPKEWGINMGDYHHQLITCPVPGPHSREVPRAVSIQARGNCNVPSYFGGIEWKPTNVLRVINEPPKTFNSSTKRSIGVCVQAFRFGSYDMSIRLVEWLELVRLLGADRVYLYEYGATDNMHKVLQFYQDEGFVVWRKVTLPGEQPNVGSLYNRLAWELNYKYWAQETLEVNDCLYRNLQQHDYLAVIDIDEIIMPQRTDNWHQLLDNIEVDLTNEQQAVNYYANRHSFVCEDKVETSMPGFYKSVTIPSHLYMMRHTYRAEFLEPTENLKSICRTACIHTLHNNFAYRCINSTGYHYCTQKAIDTRESFLMHYRRNHSANGQWANKNQSCHINDRTAWRYFKELSENVEQALSLIFV